jgi:hypothetical protein
VRGLHCAGHDESYLDSSRSGERRGFFRAFWDACVVRLTKAAEGCQRLLHRSGASSADHPTGAPGLRTRNSRLEIQLVRDSIGVTLRMSPNIASGWTVEHRIMDLRASHPGYQSVLSRVGRGAHLKRRSRVLLSHSAENFCEQERQRIARYTNRLFRDIV